MAAREEERWVIAGPAGCVGPQGYAGCGVRAGLRCKMEGVWQTSTVVVMAQSAKVPFLFS
jgi:hypothetical protein